MSGSSQDVQMEPAEPVSAWPAHADEVIAVDSQAPAPAAGAASTTAPSATGLTVPAGFRVHTESSSSILVPDEKDTKVVFLNPAQEFNRDLSIVAIRTWSEIKSAEDLARRQTQRAKQRPNKKRKLNGHVAADADAVTATEPAPTASTSSAAVEGDAAIPAPDPKPIQPYRFTLFEALSATGLRSIRYAKELPLLNWVMANDLSHSAVESIRANVELNGLAPPPSAPDQPANLGRVRVSEADATTVLYTHRTDRLRFDVIDLDPYGTAAPFIDGAVQAVKDGGLLCVTCTDMAVLAGGAYPEKAYSNYGGTTVKTEYCHETALRLVLNSIANAAARYGRHVKPMLSLSIDFYVRVFVRVYASPALTKRLISSSGIVFACTQCHSSYIQPLGRATTTDPNNSNETFRNCTGPPTPNGNICDECQGRYHVAGPLWTGPLHERDFVGQMIAQVSSSEATYGTKERIRGMVSVAHSELDVPFYFTPAKLASFFHCSSPSLTGVASALLNLGHDVSRSHAMPGSLKTTAPRNVVMDLMRAWVATHPVNMRNVRDGSPTKALLARECRTEGISFAHHPDVERKMLTSVKLVRYADTPAGHGPGKRAGMGQGGGGGTKRKAEADEASVEAA